MLLVAQGGKSGNDALARLLAIHWQRVNAVIRRSIGDRESAEELTADVFSRVWSSSGAYRPEGRFGPWLFVIVKNLVRDWLRKPHAANENGRTVAAESCSLPSLGATPDESAEMKEHQASQFQHLGLLTEAVEQTLRRLPAKHVRWWRLAARGACSKTQLAAELIVARQNLHDAEARIEAPAAAGMLVNTLLLAEPKEAAAALLSDFTLASPGRFPAIQAGERGYPMDRRLGLAYYSAEYTRALDEICGLASRAGNRAGCLVSIQNAGKISHGFEELMARAADQLASVLADPHQVGTLRGAHYVIRDCSFMFYAARVLGEHGQAAVKYAIKRLREAGAVKNIHLQREMAIIQAYTGTSGALSQWYERVGKPGYERDVDTALLLTYLAGPRDKDAFPQAVAWGEMSEVNAILTWARSHRRTVAARWMGYINYCMENTQYRTTPDLGEMVASWPGQLVTGVGVNNHFMAELQVGVERFLEDCEDRNLRVAVEKTLRIITDSQ